MSRKPRQAASLQVGNPAVADGRLGLISRLLGAADGYGIWMQFGSGGPFRGPYRPDEVRLATREEVEASEIGEGVGYKVPDSWI